MSFARRIDGHGPRARSTPRSTSSGLKRPDRRHRRPPAARRSRDAAREPGRAHRSAARPASSARTRSWSTTADGIEEHPADAVLLVHRLPAPHPRLVRSPTATGSSPPATATRRKMLPESIGRHRLGRHRRGVRPHVLVVRLRGHARSSAASRCCRARTPRSRPRWRTTSSSGASRLLKGARATRHRPRRERRGHRALRRRPGACGPATPCWPSARCRTPTASGSRPPAWRSTAAATSPINHHCRSNVPHIYAAGDV